MEEMEEEEVLEMRKEVEEAVKEGGVGRPGCQPTLAQSHNTLCPTHAWPRPGYCRRAARRPTCGVDRCRTGRLSTCSA